MANDSDAAKGIIDIAKERAKKKPRQAKPDDLKYVAAGGGMARQAADAIADRNKQLADAMKD